MADTDDLTEREARILEITALKGPISVSNILSEYNMGGITKLAASTISTSISRLYREKKCVSKVIDPSNQRVTRVDLTKKGRKLFERLEKAKMERLETLADCFTLTKEEEALFEKVCSQVVVALDQRLRLEKERRSTSQE